MRGEAIRRIWPVAYMTGGREADTAHPATRPVVAIARMATRVTHAATASRWRAAGSLVSSCRRTQPSFPVARLGTRRTLPDSAGLGTRQLDMLWTYGASAAACQHQALRAPVVRLAGTVRRRPVRGLLGQIVGIAFEGGSDCEF